MRDLKAYSSYYDSGEEWLGKLPVGWKLVKTKHLFKLITEPAPVGNNEQLLSVYTALGVRPRKELEERGNKASTTDNYWFVKKGDIIVNKLLAWMGAIGISNYDGVTSPAYDVLRAKDSVNARYYNYLFRSPFASREFKRHSRGIMEMRLRLYFNRFGDIKLPVPTPAEQDLIVRFLEYKLAKVDRFILKKQALIKLLNEQKAGIISHAITRGVSDDSRLKDSSIFCIDQIPKHWEVKKLKYVAKCFPSNIDKHSKVDESRVRLCNYTDVYKNEIIRNDQSFMSATASTEQIEKFLLKAGDVLITKDSETAEDIAVPAFVRADLDNVVCGYHLTILRPFNKILGEFLFRVLQAKTINVQFEIAAKGVTRVGLGVYDINSVKIPVPPLNEQEEIVKFIAVQTESICSAISKIEKEIGLAKEFKSSLIAEAVLGKIDVRNYLIPDLDTKDKSTIDIEEEEFSLVEEESIEYKEDL